MPLSDGQQIAAMAAVATTISAVIGYIQNRYGKRVDRAGALETRQSAIETNLLAQSIDCNKRLDALNLQIQKLETEHRVEMQRIMTENRAEITKLEKEIDDLRKDNWDLRRRSGGEKRG